MSSTHRATIWNTNRVGSQFPTFCRGTEICIPNKIGLSWKSSITALQKILWTHQRYVLTHLGHFCWRCQGVWTVRLQYFTFILLKISYIAGLISSLSRQKLKWREYVMTLCINFTHFMCLTGHWFQPGKGFKKMRWWLCNKHRGTKEKCNWILKLLQHTLSKDLGMIQS